MYVFTRIHICRESAAGRRRAGREKRRERDEEVFQVSQVS